jgi:uncharacterized protein
MIIKFLALAAILFLIYVTFFKKSKKEVHSDQKDKNSGDVMLECSQCGTFVSEDESIVKDGKFYCSKECATS